MKKNFSVAIFSTGHKSFVVAQATVPKQQMEVHTHCRHYWDVLYMAF